MSASFCIDPGQDSNGENPSSSSSSLGELMNNDEHPEEQSATETNNDGRNARCINSYRHFRMSDILIENRLRLCFHRTNRCVDVFICHLRDRFQ